MQAPYLAHTLVSEGALLRQYYGIGDVSNDNDLALIAGGPPTLATQQDCPHSDEFVQTGTAADGPSRRAPSSLAALTRSAHESELDPSDSQ
jgi:hypothetical protein